MEVAATVTDTLHVLQVFCGPDGNGGNPLGVFIDAAGWPESRRQTIAADLGFSETVFITDAARAELRIHTPTVELPFAGHPLVGAAWLLRDVGAPVEVLRPPAGEIATWVEHERTWISAPAQWAPEFDLRQVPSPGAVETHPGAGPDELVQVWAWQNQTAGTVRVRVFPTALGIVEDEATGAAAIRLGALLQRPLIIHQGKSSEIMVRPTDETTIAVGGFAKSIDTHRY